MTDNFKPVFQDDVSQAVADAINKHISRDVSVSPEDQEWETRNAINSVCEGVGLGMMYPPPNAR